LNYDNLLNSKQQDLATQLNKSSANALVENHWPSVTFSNHSFREISCVLESKGLLGGFKDKRTISVLSSLKID